MGRSVVRGGMLVLRRVAATHVPAFKAQPQVNPRVAFGQTFLAAIGSVGLTVEGLSVDGTEVGTSDLAHAPNQITKLDWVSQRGRMPTAYRPLRVSTRFSEERMRTRVSFVVVAAVFVLAGCQGHEAITGGYGSTGVSGVVSMAAGMTNSSPQGVRVGVSGTGMSAVLGPDGRFSFFGAPENATLTFSRDDVNASIKAEGSGPMQIELNSNHANLGRHRVVPSGPLMQIEGLITAIGTTDITVHDSHNQDVKVTITTDTAIYKGNQKLQLSDLKVGDRVHVQAKVSGDATNAVVVILQNPDDDSGDDNNNSGSQTMTANGTVKSVGTGELTVTTVPKGDVVVKVDGTTIIRKQGATITLADIHTGDQVNTMGTRIDDHTLQAKQIEVRGVSGHH